MSSLSTVEPQLPALDWEIQNQNHIIRDRVGREIITDELYWNLLVVTLEYWCAGLVPTQSDNISLAVLIMLFSSNAAVNVVS